MPFRSKLQERIEPGQTLSVKGRAHSTSKAFSINFLRGGDFEQGDRALHVSVRFDEKKVVLNTHEHGKWGKEERHSHHMKQGDKFDIRIRTHADRFQIFFNGEEFAKYDHRMPVSSIDHFSVEGDCEITHVHWGGKYYPVPFESHITGELNPGRRLTIYGIVDKKCKFFVINLKKGHDIVLHFNPRLDDKHVIRNSFIGGVWGNEEKEGKMVFHKEHIFDIEIANESYGFQIFVNGELYCSFAHRSEPQGVNGLEIKGDVELTGIVVD